jgi:hypothetical protein
MAGGPTKHDYGDKLGELTQSNFEFLKELWDDSTGPALRNQLLNQPNEASLRTFLDGKGIKVAADVRIMVFDVLTLEKKSFVTSAATDKFYLLVLPPAPRRNPGQSPYKDIQCWLAAHYHAINDSYGM